jgi:hypothetical protein
MIKLDLEFWVYLSCMAVRSILLTATLFLSLRLFKTMINSPGTKAEVQEFDDSQAFKNEIRHQIVYQQVNSALEKVMAGIDEQRSYIQNLISETGAADLKTISGPEMGLPSDPAVFRPAQQMPATAEAFEEKQPMSQISSVLDQPSSGNPYDQITELLRKGLEPDEIADQLGLARVEVDLFIQLRIPKEQGRDQQTVLFQASA